MIVLFIFFIIMYVLFSKLLDIQKKRNMLDIEINIVRAALELYVLKYHMTQMLEIIYEKASEVDDQYNKDYDKIKKSLDDKIEIFGNQFINNLEKSLGYKLRYNNWTELIKIAELFTTQHKKNEPRKRD